MHRCRVRVPASWLAVLAIASACSSSSSSPATGKGGDSGVDSGADAGPGDDSGFPMPPACTETVARQPVATALVLPAAGEAPFVTSLKKAKKTIRLMAAQLGTGEVLSTLETSAKAGVSVQVILDEGQQAFNQPAHDALVSAGAKAQFSSATRTTMRADAFVVDASEAVISTAGFVAAQMQAQRDYAAVDDDPHDIASLTSLFDADWAGQPTNVTCTRFLITPDNGKTRLVDFMNSPKTTLDMEGFDLSDPDMQAALLDDFTTPITMRVLVADPAFDPSSTAAVQWLKANKIPAKMLTSPALHAKAAIVDAAHAYLGTENGSFAPGRAVGLELLTYNGEDISAIQSAFDADWAAGTSVSP
jgi:phosphatidylserine/phosphatidylglycerophosphate/cardiolipin synthase-like enzyme